MLAPLCVTTAYNCTVSWKTQSQNRRRGTIRMAIFWYLVQHVIYSSVWVWSAVYVNLNALLNKKNHNYYSYHVEIENGKSLLLSRACFWKYLPPFVLLMGLEIKLHLCDFLVCVPTFPVCWSGTCSVQPSPCLPPGDSAGGSARIRYWPASGTPDAGKRKKRGKISEFFLIDCTKKQMSSSYLPVTFCFILFLFLK